MSGAIALSVAAMSANALPAACSTEVVGSPFSRPPGWRGGTPADAGGWCRTYGGADYPDELVNPRDCLPTDYETYTLVAFGLDDLDVSRFRQQVRPAENEAEVHRRISALVARREAHPGVVGRSPGESQALRAELGVGDAAAYMCGLFVDTYGQDTCTVTGPAFAQYSVDYQHAYPSVVFWMPSDKSWVVSEPYAANFAYVGGDQNLASQLRANPSLVTFGVKCTI